jgi:hypothetical protein
MDPPSTKGRRRRDPDVALTATRSLLDAAYRTLLDVIGEAYDER